MLTRPELVVFHKNLLRYIKQDATIKSFQDLESFMDQVKHHIDITFMDMRILNGEQTKEVRG